ncbi:hypothetical protein [Nostoc sp.]|uniref:hypothetical protein n=1 Tax=Nostoc sp. TaxID=1180 RepID=UPI002FFAAAFF
MSLHFTHFKLEVLIISQSSEAIATLRVKLLFWRSASRLCNGHFDTTCYPAGTLKANNGENTYAGVFGLAQDKKCYPKNTRGGTF